MHTIKLPKELVYYFEAKDGFVYIWISRQRSVIFDSDGAIEISLELAQFITNSKNSINIIDIRQSITNIKDGYYSFAVIYCSREKYDQ